MVIPDNSSTETMNNASENQHPNYNHLLNDEWVLWGHLPHNADWSINSYIKIASFKYLEEAISITERLPSTLVENCMLFLMRKGINPTWEDPKNRGGGFFSYKVMCKNVHKCWKDLTYVIVGDTVSKDTQFVENVTGITISPKKNFCIIKIWMTDCSKQNPAIVTSDLKGLNNFGCLFKKHTPEF
jgi:hypothetical protein